MGSPLNRARHQPSQRSGWSRALGAPATTSLLVAAAFYLTFLSLFRSGYAINDDMKMIPMAVGFPTGHPVPFLVFSNVLLGSLLVGLYRLPTGLNWEVLLFILVQFGSVWLLLDQIMSSRLRPGSKAFGAVVIMMCAAYFALNITFTTTATFAAMAGCCGILYWARHGVTDASRQLVVGAVLLLCAVLIRWDAVPLMVLLAAPFGILMHRELQLRRLIPAMLAIAVLAAGGWLADRLYVRASPDWNVFYRYQYTNGLVQDTHRRENLGRAVRRIGWSPNDQELFYRWYYGDQETYSLDRLMFLVERVSPVSSNAAVTLLSVLEAPFAPYLVPYLIAIVAASLWMIWGSRWKRAAPTVVALWCLCLGVNAYLAVAWKIADRIFLATFSATALLTFMIPLWLGAAEARATSMDRASSGRTWALYVSLIALGLAGAAMLVQSIRTSATNREKQAIYHQVLADISELQRNGTLVEDALIVSPAHGLPMEWANPWTLRLPTVDYFDIGWLAFSPFYEDVLQTHGIGDLPEAMYQKQNVYLMTRVNILPYIARSFEEHQGVKVSFRDLYSMPNPARYSGYEDVHLYQVIAVQ